MAKTLLIRPHVVALCACRPHFLSSRAVPCSQATKPYQVTPRVLFSRRFGLQPRVGCETKSDGILVGRRSLSIRATTQVNDSGSIDSPLMRSMEKKIKEHLNAESVTVKDAYGDGRHVSMVAWKAVKQLVIEELEVALPYTMEVRLKILFNSLCQTHVYF